MCQRQHFELGDLQFCRWISRGQAYRISKRASLIATSTVHSKLDYWNSLYYNLPKYQTRRLQLIQNSLACAFVEAPKSTHVIPILKYVKSIGIK